MAESENINYGVAALVAVVAAVVSSLVTYKALSGKTEKVAVVDFQQVVMVSKDVVALKEERETQIAELQKMADAANEKITAESDEEKKRQLSEQHLAEINAKKAEFDKLYASSLQASDKKLNNIVKSVAKKKGLKIILNKTAVLEGGEDITDAVIERIK